MPQISDANYLLIFKALGKLCYMWDTVVAAMSTTTATTATLKAAAAAMFDQVATGNDAANWPQVVVFAPYAATIDSAINNGSSGFANLKTAIESATAAYLTSSVFRDKLTTAPTTPSSAQSCLEALIAAMTADSKTLTTASSSGLVNFFETVWSPSGDFPQSGSPTYADATYAVAAIV